MGIVSSLLTRIRIELTDKQKSRWTDADLIALVSEGVEMVNHLLCKNGIPIGRKEYEFSTVNGQTEYSVPEDFLSPSGLFRTDTSKALAKYPDSDWYRVVSTAEGSIWRVINGKMQIKDTPKSAISMVLQYWPVVCPDCMNANTSIPWDGAMDSIIKEIVCLRAKNIDESDSVQNNAQFLQAAEKLILSSYSSVDSGRATVVGYLE